MPAHAPPPLQDPILSFSHTFSLKSAHVGGQNPAKMGPRPPTENPGSSPVNNATNTADVSGRILKTLKTIEVLHINFSLKFSLIRLIVGHFYVP